MRRKRLAWLFFYAAGLLTGAPNASTLHLMPWPQLVEVKSGALPVTGNFRIDYSATSAPRLQRAAQRLLVQISHQTGIPLVGKGRYAGLMVECSQTLDGPDTLRDDESYQLDVGPRGATLRSKSVTGALRGMQTFLQLIAIDPVNGFSAPSVHIVDAPRFAWRGLLIDVTSHFMPVAVIKRNMDAMEAVKLNVFHWHLTDDQGFRLESKVFPKLHELGSGGDYYTYDQVKELLAYAHDRGIRVVPEIDMPGHCATWLIGYPEIASGPGPYSIIPTFGVYDPALDPTREATYQFIEKLIAEYATLFPDEYFHIGGDEVNGKQWQANQAIQEFIKQHKLTNEAGLQAYFNRRVVEIVKKNGKTMMGWDEVLHPDLPHDIVIESWRDQQSMFAAAKAGHRALLSFGYYLDHLDTAGYHYSVDPLVQGANRLSGQEAANILGGEACMWTEFISPETIDSRIWPKTAAIAERLWSAAYVRDESFMYRRLDAVSADLDWRGVTHNTSYLPMLERLAGDQPVGPLKLLADALQPLGIEGRERTRRYDQSTPLNRLVDAARGESTSPRRALNRQTLIQWRDTEPELTRMIRRNAMLQEALPLAAALSRTATIGLEALHYSETNQHAPPGWMKARMEELKRLSAPVAEMQLAAVNQVRKLVQAAGELRSK